MTFSNEIFGGQPVGWATFENLDHLLQLEMRPYGLSQGIVPRLYRHARAPEEQPLCMQAAHELLRRRGSSVAIFTGLLIPHYMPRGETDGPLGAAVLARALTALGCQATIICEREIAPVVQSLIDILGASAVTVAEAPAADAPSTASAIASEYAVGIAIEKLGANARGVRHTVGGNAVVTGDQQAEKCIDAIRRNGGFTIGIGDNGNEIGFGKIAPLIRGLVPHGDVCRCECGGGIVTTQATDLLMPCAVSNYGGYVITAALACLTERPDLCVADSEVEAMLRRALELGCVNGGIEDTGFVGDDGVPLEAARSYATLVKTVASQYFVRVGSHH